VGAIIDSTGYWGREPNALFKFTYENQRSQYTGKSVKIDGQYGVAGGVARKQIPEWLSAKKKLFGFWIRVSDMNGGQLKIANFEASTTHGSTPGLVQNVMWKDSDTPDRAKNAYAQWPYTSDTSNTIMYFRTNDVLPRQISTAYYWGKWQYNLIEVEESDIGTNNGQIRYSMSQTSPTSGIIKTSYVTNRSTRSSLTTGSSWVKLRCILESGATLADVYYDDVYIDDSWQRVEIGNQPIYANCTHREMQIPMAWEDQKIQFKFNQGSFANGQTVYAFVVDNNGVPNEKGVAINIGQTASSTTPESTTPPTAPKNLRIATTQ
jgi:hypothetical protein